LPPERSWIVPRVIGPRGRRTARPGRLCPKPSPSRPPPAALPTQTINRARVRPRSEIRAFKFRCRSTRARTLTAVAAFDPRGRAAFAPRCSGALLCFGKSPALPRSAVWRASLLVCTAPAPSGAALAQHSVRSLDRVIGRCQPAAPIVFEISKVPALRLLLPPTPELCLIFIDWRASPPAAPSRL